MARRALLLRRTLQVLLLLPLIALAVDWIRSPDPNHLASLGWSASIIFIILLLGPWWINTHRKRDPLLEMPRHPGMAILIYGLFLFTGMPIVSVWAVIWAGMSLYLGVRLMISGDLAFGLLTATIPLLGLVGIYTLWALARFYVRLPRANPSGRQLLRHALGLCIGVSVVLFIWTVGDIWNWGWLFGYVAFWCLPPLIATVFFILLMSVNRFSPPRPNPSSNADALKRAG